MALFTVPLPDFNKTFEIICETKEDVEKFEKKGGIWGYNPFLKYIERFDNNYGYSVSVRETNHLFGKGKTYSYSVFICDIKE